MKDEIIIWSLKFLILLVYIVIGILILIGLILFCVITNLSIKYILNDVGGIKEVLGYLWLILVCGCNPVTLYIIDELN